MTKNQGSLQDAFLNQVRKDNVPVIVYLVNGVQLKGMVRGFDSYTVILDSDGRQQMVYKHAISTVQPARPVNPVTSERESRSRDAEER